MSRAFGLISLVVALAVGWYAYTHQAKSVSPTPLGSPRATADLIGVKNDLLAMAQAERAHNATHGAYVSLDELRSQGDLTMTRENRGPYKYSSEISEGSFRIVATYSGPDPQMPRTLTVDETMVVTYSNQ